MKQNFTIRADQLPLIQAFRTFAAVGGFTAAAGPLGITPSAVSQRIRQLEAALQLRLFERTTRGIRLTDAGKGLLDEAGRPLRELLSAIERVRSVGAGPSGTLRINLSRLAAEICILPRLFAFARAFPAIRVELCTDDRLSDIVATDFDAGIRMAETLEDDMIARRIGPPLRRALLPSPDYLIRFGVPSCPDDLHAHAVIRYRFSGSRRLEPLTFRVREQDVRIDPPARMVLDDNNHIALAVREGLGIAQRFRATEESAIRSGELREILGACEPNPSQFHLYHPSREQPPKLRAFIEWFAPNRST